MRNVSEHKDFDKLTKIGDKLYIRAILDPMRYPLFDESGNKKPDYDTVWASLLVLQEAYQQAIADLYTALNTLPLRRQKIYGFRKACLIEDISYVVFLDAIVVNFDCKEGKS